MAVVLAYANFMSIQAAENAGDIHTPKVTSHTTESSGSSIKDSALELQIPRPNRGQDPLRIHRALLG
jgi:hypothetical protein